MQKFQSLLPRLLALVAAVALCSISLQAQQTLGGITGEVTDASGGVIPNVTVTAIDEQTALTRTTKTNATGTYSFVNLPIDSYTLTFAADGYEAQKTPHITVQANRTASVNAALKVGQASTTVEVEAVPLMNAVDTTNGYVMEKEQIDSVPLPTGSFTGLAILSPGVNAELSGGTGVNSGMGNAPIWANGQRDTSNEFLLNGVDTSNLFNGKSTSQVESSRVVNNTGNGNSSAGVEQSASSVYLSIGNAMPTPAPETLQEVRVNASMYDAQQGSASGAHIDMSTSSGSNSIHGNLYGRRGTNWLNAAPFFFKNNSGIPDEDKNPQLHRYTAGGTFGGPIIKDKLFGFLAYQHLHVSDQETGDTLLAVPPGLNDTNRLDPSQLATLTDKYWGDTDAENGFSVAASDWNNNPLALDLLKAKLPNGQWLIPNDNGHTPDPLSPANAFESGTSYFTADQVVANLDWNPTKKDQVSFKYYWQHDPNSTPYATSNVPGFTEHLDAGAQVGSITNIQTLGSSFSVTETVGVLREKAYSTNDQLWAPGQSGTPVAGMTSGFGSYFPGITIVDILGAYGSDNGVSQQSLSIGPSAANQSAFTG
ncbi:MAG TPA: carboxypeptidase-like regulatory domain-containing protein, partial [Terracidiphilus sp.]|nr:carboxypeptidase-like regulatory domain-containing protein [Terracidiphilus sp.]